MSSASPSSRLQESSTGIAIDVMRGLLSLLVLVAHSLESAAITHGTGNGDSLLHTTLFHGGFWVNGFFVLSGFCVHRSVMGMRKRGGAFYRPYGSARISRIYPMYAVALLLTAISWALLGPFLASDTQGWAERSTGHVLMVQGITGSFHELKPAWSLTYEAAYYLAWPLVLAACGWRAVTACVVGGFMALITGALVMAGWRWSGGAGDSMLIPLWLIPAQFILWLGGAWLAATWDRIVPWARSWWFMVAIAGIVVCYFAQAWLLQHGARQWMLLALGYVTLPFWLGLIAASTQWQGASRWSGTARVLGLLSYPLYILHQVLLDAAVRLLPSSGLLWLDALALGGLVLGLILALGVPLEAAILRWRAAWLVRGRRPLDPAGLSTSAQGN